MLEKYNDFYAELSSEGIAPKNTREQNYEILSRAYSKWRSRGGGAPTYAMQGRINNAMKVFKHQHEYENFRGWYSEYKLWPFIEGAVEGNKLAKVKYNEALQKGKNLDITKKEIDGFIEKKKIVVQKIQPKTFIALAFLSPSLVLIIFFIIRAVIPVVPAAPVSLAAAVTPVIAADLTTGVKELTFKADYLFLEQTADSLEKALKAYREI